MPEPEDPDQLLEDPTGWDLDERDAWLAEHDDEYIPAPVRVVIAEDE